MEKKNHHERRYLSPKSVNFGIPFYSKIVDIDTPIKLYELYKYQYQYRLSYFRGANFYES